VNDAQDIAAGDSQQPPVTSRPETEDLTEAELLQKLFWNVEEVAFICRVGKRTVWRLMADPKSKFPTPRRIRGRTLLARDEVLAYLGRTFAR
jgi:predicted DNA-binding transcriptional regulator AlpA